MTKEKHERAARTIQRILVHDLDPISLRPIKTPFLVRRGEALLLYDARTLFSYVQETGDTRDPIARQPFLNHELKRLYRTCGISPVSFQDLAKKNQEEERRRDLVRFLENEMINESRSNVVELPRLLEVFLNLRSLCSEGELESSLSYLRRNGIDIELEDSFIPVSMTLHREEEEQESSVVLYAEDPPSGIPRRVQERIRSVTNLPDHPAVEMDRMRRLMRFLRM